jgi:hypothetical protein
MISCLWTGTLINHFPKKYLFKFINLIMQNQMPSNESQPEGNAPKKSDELSKFNFI